MVGRPKQNWIVLQVVTLKLNLTEIFDGGLLIYSAALPNIVEVIGSKS